VPQRRGKYITSPVGLLTGPCQVSSVGVCTPCFNFVLVMASIGYCTRAAGVRVIIHAPHVVGKRKQRISLSCDRVRIPATEIWIWFTYSLRPCCLGGRSTVSTSLFARSWTICCAGSARHPGPTRGIVRHSGQRGTALLYGASMMQDRTYCMYLA
jgi:hypothetical protein